ncbi:hypothetical protein [Brevundimonas sp.]|uniref:hypothetical protein n=1 Tax=Brevundimonas sp. TaxID=1871086 RepID=UPI00391940EA
METIAIPFETDAADRLKRAAAEIGMSVEAFVASAAEQIAAEQEAGAPLSDDQIASIRRGLEDVAAGRVYDHDEVFAELKARYRR